MKLLGICGASGVGKTSLIEGLIAALKAEGQRVSVIKHAHQGFDLDAPGTDTSRHARAGALEVLIASSQRVAKMREFDAPAQPTVHQLIGELHECGWVLAEGFKHADVLKLEVWRAALDVAPLYPEDPFVFGIATDDPDTLPVPTLRPVFRLDNAAALAEYLLREGDRFEYQSERHG
jgi:molybdopterin-guanine dinucleotide biosynthesis adapter protein